MLHYCARDRLKKLKFVDVTEIAAILRIILISGNLLERLENYGKHFDRCKWQIFFLKMIFRSFSF